MRYLVTGTAGFIGFHVAKRLLDEGHEVVGLDGFTAYYDVALKESRHRHLEVREGYRGYRAMLEDVAALERIWASEKVDIVIHLAAQAGVRYSLQNPRSYMETNLTGTFNVLELVRRYPVGHFMLASTSSVYGANLQMPFREDDRTQHPLTIYAATKMSTELIAHCYSHLWKQPTTAFRFFTVYGPWGRPDMALYKFVKAIVEDKPIDVYNHGRMRRDFTYVDDLVESIVRLAAVAPPVLPEAEARAAAEADPSLSPVGPYRVVNIAGGHPQPLGIFIEEIERALGKKSVRNLLPMQAGDVPATSADPAVLDRLIGYRPSTTMREGITRFVAWYREYHRV